MASGLVENDKGIHSYKLKTRENASEGAAVLAIRPRALVGRSPTSSSLRSEAWPAARASSLVLRSRGRLVDDAQRLTSDKDFSVHVERCPFTWFERLSSCFGRLCRYNCDTYKKIRGRTAKTSVFRVERRLSSSFHDASFVPLL